MVTFYKGDGTEYDPYIIKTSTSFTAIEQLTLMGDALYVASGSYFRLAEDVDLSGISWTAIGTSSIPFNGIFDGDGYTISNHSSRFANIGDGCIIKRTIFNGNKSNTITNNFIQGITTGSTITQCEFNTFYAKTSDENLYMIQSVTNVSNCSFNSIKLDAYFNHDTCVAMIDGGNVSNCYAIDIENYARSTNYHAPTCSILSMGCTLVSSCAVISGSVSAYSGSYKVALSPYGRSNTTLSSCYQNNSITVQNGYFSVQSGTQISESEFYNESFWHGGSYLSWDFDDIWSWDSENNIPKLILEHTSLATLYVKVNSSWEGGFPYIKANNVWNESDAVYVKVNGVWELQS